MELKKENINDVLVVNLNGKLDAISSNNVAEQIFGFINEGNNKVILDMTELEYISSAGLQVILQLTKKLTAQKGSFALCSLSSDVNDVIEMSGFSSFLSIFDDLDSAIKSI